jgi:hypothetical protein
VTLRKPIACLAAATALCVAPKQALADRSTIKSDTDHPSYIFEAEPHLVLAPFHKKGGFGAGFEGTFNVADQGFINGVNDSVGVGFGVNWATNEKFLLSAAMQWNFWLSENWSVFGEPGGVIRISDGKKDAFDYFAIYGGARLHFSDTIALTMRVGKPTFSIGVSFML